MIFLGPKIIKGSPEKLLSYYFIEFFNFLHWPKLGPNKFIILESINLPSINLNSFYCSLIKEQESSIEGLKGLTRKKRFDCGREEFD